MKPLGAGVALFNGPRTTPRVGADCIVLDAMSLKWSVLEPQDGVFDFARVDKALEYAQRAGFRAADLRIFAGTWTAPWLLKLAGSVPYTDGQDGGDDPVVQFWKPVFVQRYRKLMEALADRYGPHQMLRSVGHTLPMTRYVEPFMRGNPASRTALHKAGLNDATDLAAHKAGIDVHRDVWLPHGVRLRLALNPWMSVERGKSDVEALRQVVDYALEQLGVDGLILQNNSIRVPMLGGQYPALYELMQTYRRKGVALGFQTAADARIGDVQATLDWAVSQGAHWVEPPPSVWSGEQTFDWPALNRALRGNAPPEDLRPVVAELQRTVEALRVQLGEANNRLAAVKNFVAGA